MKKILPLLFLTATLTGASVDFRGGEILNAEISSKIPAGAEKIDPLLYPDLPEKKIYAALTILLHPGRKLSVFDYSLYYNDPYPCVAIREENGPFQFDCKRDFYDSTGKKKFTLLFILHRDRLSASGELYLKTNFMPEKHPKQVIMFRMLGDKPFTAPGAVRAAGTLPEK